jgi:hypothetical protein
MKFLTTYLVASELETIIKEAKKELTLVTPYLNIPNILFQRLQSAAARGVMITIIYGKSELRNNEENRIKTLPGLELYFFKNLHAKCYFSERAMIISSMNLYDYSEKNNREMGILINRGNKIYKDATEETLDIKALSELNYRSENLEQPLVVEAIAQPLKTTILESRSFEKEAAFHPEISGLSLDSDLTELEVVKTYSQGNFISFYAYQKNGQYHNCGYKFGENGFMVATIYYENGSIKTTDTIDFFGKFSMYDLLLSVINIIGQIYKIPTHTLEWRSDVRAITGNKFYLLKNYLNKELKISIDRENHTDLSELVNNAKQLLRGYKSW